ncbi:hypothetical protein HanHA300_Chr06g0221491 [Helianthus annuus]|nr:hypothetical protein HanHA300_Chr06g0221491 [Helianthus annuus]
MLLDRTGLSTPSVITLRTSSGRGKDTDKGHNVPCSIDVESTTGTVVEKMATFLRESRIAKALSDKTVVYESHVRAFWNTARYEATDKTIHAVVKKKDEKEKDIDIEVVFGVGDVRRVLELQDSDNDPKIMSERLAKGLWCRMGFTAHINGKMYKRSFSKAYRYLMHCMVHSLSHRKGAYDEVSDYIMNIVVSLVLNKRYNISQVIFEFMKENCEAGIDKYIMYPRFILMILNDKIKDLPKDSNDVMEMSVVNKATMLRITKDKDAKTKELICAMKDKAYVAPEDDKWRHDNSSSDNEDNRTSEMVEKKTRWWCIREGKRKKAPKSTPVVVTKETEKGFSGEPQRRLIDETIIEPTVVIEQDDETLKQTLESYFKKNEELAAQQAQKSVAQKDETQKSSSDEDSEATLSESELVAETVGKGKVQLKKKSSMKRKDSDEEDSPYDPDQSKKNRKKRKAAPAGVIPRNVRARKLSAESQTEIEGKKKQDDVEKSPAAETQKETPIVESKKLNEDDDYVEITGVKFASPKPFHQDIPESSQLKSDDFNLDFDSLGGATGNFFDDMPEGESDMFNDQVVKDLVQRVKALEKEKAEADAERNKLKKKIDELIDSNNNFVDALVVKENRMKKMKEDIEDNAQIVENLTSEIASLNAKVQDLQNINQTLNQLLNEMNEASSNEMKAMKLEMEAMKADKVMKDQQLQMLTAVVETHLKLNVHEAFDQIDIIKANERRQERERQLAEEANLKNKGITEEVEVVDASQNQPDMGGSSSQPDVVMVDIQEVAENDEEMVEAENEEVHEPEFLMVGEPVEPIIPEKVHRDVEVIQRKRKAREVLLLEYITDKFVMVGDAYPVPYNGKEVAKLTRFYELKRKGKIARGEIVDDDSDSDLFGDGEEEEEDDDQDDKADDKSDKDDKPDDDNDQGTSGLLINDPSVQDKVNELMNNEVNEQNDDEESEASSSGKQSDDQER